MKRILSVVLAIAITLSLVLPCSFSASATEMKTAIGTVEATSGLRLRAKATTASTTLAVAPQGDHVVIIRKTGSWYLVNYNLHIGYMHADYLRVTDSISIDLGKGTLDPWLTNVRKSATTSSAVIDQLSRGKKVKIVGFEHDWYKVAYDSIIGYIRSDLITLVEKPAGNHGISASVGSGSSSTTSKGQKIADYAKSFVGYPYVYGGASPSGFDCSGFVQYVYKQNGISINRTATAQLSNGYYVSYNDMKPGDIIYFGYGNSASHVGIYIGNGNFVHAQNSSTGVVITSLSQSYYANRYLCAHRIVD